MKRGSPASGASFYCFLFVSYLLFVASPEEVIGGNPIILAKGQQVVDRQLVGAALVSGIHGLRGAEEVCNLLLRFVVILTQIA